MSRGWVTNHRKIKDWEWYKVPHMAHLFQHLIREANRAPNSWRGQVIKRGQLITGRKALSTETGIPEQSVRTCLLRLKKTGDIVTQSTNQYTLITLCHYNSYQDPPAHTPQRSTSQLTNDQPTINQPANHKQQVNNQNNVNKLHIVFQDFWNSHKTLPPIRTMTKDRIAKFKVRMNEPEFNDNWQQIIVTITTTPFLCGDNDRGWKANVDWILKNATNYIKILESKYASPHKETPEEAVARLKAKGLLDDDD